MKKLLLLLAALLLPVLAHATDADETTILTTPIVVTVSGYRAGPIYHDPSVKSSTQVTAYACVGSAANCQGPIASVLLDRNKVTTLEVTPGGTTLVRGWAVDFGGKSATCSKTGAQVNAFMIAVTSGPVLDKASSDIVNTCLN